ncbi:MAG TPA: DUF4178 domain-containing protein [Chitinolyticbacter sp.]|nr:DUF4178 domain-containing protein [Chitinolyticbacter sp.]
MYRTACPSCGAEVAFRSAASVMAVCEYCRGTLVRDAESVREQGKMSAVIEDYSRIQLGTSGLWQGKAFTVLGRIQLRYDAGFWNEWYALFDDGAAGWLSESNGLYVFTVDAGVAEPPPLFDKLQPDMPWCHQGRTFRLADKREAQCSGGEGELPFVVGAGWQARVSDWRAAEQFLTLDYSEKPVRVYLGQAVRLEDLRCQLLREDDAIVAATGRMRGSVVQLACPSCGGGLSYPSGLATQLVCPACAAVVDGSADTSQVVAQGQQLAAVKSALALGETGTIDGRRWTIIGRLQCQDGEGERWFEYLLFHPTAGFFWLVESEEGWSRVQLLDHWPDVDGHAVKLKNQRYVPLYSYSSTVVHAAGAFNWRARVGDRVAVSDYSGNGAVLSCETSGNEVVWSRSQRVDQGAVLRWFKRKESAATPVQPQPLKSEAVPAGASEGGSLLTPFITLLLVLNVPIWFISGLDGSVFFVTLIAALALWWPSLQEQ